MCALGLVSASAAWGAGGNWYVSDGAEGPRERINASCIDEDKLLAGDFDGDGKTDVFTTNAVGGEWHVSYGGRSQWQRLNKSSKKTSEVRLGDFDGDGKTDVFTSEVKNGYWHISYGGSQKWKQVNKSGFDVDDLRFGDRDHDGSMDVFAEFDGSWHVSYGATSSWQTASSGSAPGEPRPGRIELRHGDYVGDARADLFSSDQVGCEDGPSTAEVFEYRTCETLDCAEGYHPTAYYPASVCTKPQGGSGKGQAVCRENGGPLITTCASECPTGYEQTAVEDDEGCTPWDNPGVPTSDPTGSALTCKKSDGTGSGSSALTASSSVPRERPAVFSRAPGRLDVVGRGRDDRYYLSSWDGQRWSGWAAIGVGEFLSGPAVASLGSPRRRGDGLTVVGLGKDRRFYQAGWNGQNWTGWSAIGSGTFLSGPALVGGSRPQLVGRGMDRRLYVSEHRSGAWSPWVAIGDGTFTSAPTAVRLTANRLDVFALGDDRGVYQNWRFDDEPWQGWRRIGEGTFRSAPAAVSWGEDRLDLFAIGDDSHLWQSTWTAAGWAGWILADGEGLLDSAPGAWSAATNRLDLVAVGLDQRIWHKAWLGDRWTRWLADTPAGTFK